MKKTVCFISPTYNASFHLEECYESLREQSNKDWSWVILNDMSNDDTFEIANRIAMSDERERVIVINHALCNENTVDLILKEYNNNPELDALWTAHSWDINGMNISRELPRDINPYQYPWVSSHLKTFKVSVFKKIKKENFQDLDGNWFERGCDQALYLPILRLSRDLKFLNEICYLYKINTKSFEFPNDNKNHKTIKLIRSRGLLN